MIICTKALGISIKNMSSVEWTPPLFLHILSPQLARKLTQYHYNSRHRCCTQKKGWLKIGHAKGKDD